MATDSDGSQAYIGSLVCRSYDPHRLGVIIGSLGDIDGSTWVQVQWLGGKYPSALKSLTIVKTP
jgi:hypothetical protein